MQKYRTIQEILNGGRHLWKQMTKVDLIYTLLFCCMCLCFCEGELRCFLSYLCSCQSLFHVLNYHAGCHLSIIGLAAGRNIVLVNNQAHNRYDVTRNGWGRGEREGNLCWYNKIISLLGNDFIISIQAWPPFLLSERSCQQTICGPRTLNIDGAKSKSKLNQEILHSQNGSLSLL